MNSDRDFGTRFFRVTHPRHRVPKVLQTRIVELLDVARDQILTMRRRHRVAIIATSDPDIAEFALDEPACAVRWAAEPHASRVIRVLIITPMGAIGLQLTPRLHPVPENAKELRP